MAHIPPAERELRFNDAKQQLLQSRQELDGPVSDWYIIQCPCRPDCECISKEEVPRLVFSPCLYVGELDRFYVEQPFLETHGFRVMWICDLCNSEFCCGFPM